MTPASKKYDLFISYGRGDDDEFVRMLFDALTKNGYNVWYDRESMESNGLSFLQNIRDSLAENPIRLILVVSPHSVQSLFVNAEWQFALENCQPVMPVLRMGLERNKNGDPISSNKDFELLPGALLKRRLHCIDFRRERDFSEPLHELLNSLSKEVRILTKLHGVINKPNNYIDREQNIDQIKESILADTYEPTVVTSTGKATAVQGMGGIGKSVVAAAVCHDCDVRRSFQDGIYWVTFGQNPDLQKALQYITKDDTINVRDKYEEARDKLSAFLKDKNCLIVLDDVWKQEHIELFPGDDALRSRLLITTRNKQTVKNLSRNIFEIGLLSNEDALLLLASASNKKLEGLPDEAVEIINECGNLPLAISMIGGMIRAGDDSTWKHSLDMLKAADLKVIAQKFPGYPYPDLFNSIDISIHSLREDERNKYLQLAVFKEDTRIPEEILHLLWKADNWKEYHTHGLINNYVERSILQRIDHGIYGLHDLLFDYIQKTVTDLPAIHQRLINNLGDPLKLSHPYSRNNYIRHLKEAGKMDDAIMLLQNFDWMDARLHAGNIHELLTDYEHFDLDEDTDLIYRSLKLSIHVLVEDPDLLPAQLMGRIGYFKREPIIKVWEKANHWNKKDWLRPVKPSLTAPGNLLGILKGHTSTVRSLVVRGDHIISGSYDHTIRIWDIKSGQCLQILQGAKESVNAIVVHEDKIISASYKTINTWHIESGQRIQALDGHTMLIKFLSVQDNKIISSDDGVVCIWDLASGRCLQKLRSQAKLFTSLVVLEDKIITSSYDSTVRIWEIKSGECLRTLNGHTDSVVSLKIKGDLIVSGSEDRTVRIWEIKTGRCLQILHGHTDAISSVAIWKDNIISGSDDGDIRTWHIPSGQCIHTLKAHNGKDISLLNYENKIISWSNDRVIRIWDIDSGQCLQTLAGHTRGIRFLRIHEGRIFSGSDDYTIKIWEISSGNCLQTLKGHTGEIDSLLIDNGKIFSGSRDSSIRIWEIANRYNLPLQVHSNQVSSLLVRAGKIITGSYDKTIRTWDIATGLCTQTLEGHTGWILCLLIYKDMIISGSDDKTIRIWEMETGRCLHTLRGHTGDISSLAVHDDKIVSGSYDNTIRIWEIVSGQCLQILQAPGGSTWILSVLILGNKIISGSTDGGIRIWEITSGQCLHTLQGHKGEISALLLHEDKIISGSSDHTIGIWDIESGSCLNMLRGTSGWIRSLLVYDNKILSGSHDNFFNENYTVHIWDMESGLRLRAIEGHKGKIHALLVEQDKLMSIDTSGLLLVHDIKTFTQIAKYYSDAEFTTQIVFEQNRIMIGDKLGQIHILELMHV